MTEPTTTLNAQFSGPGANPTSWDDTRRTLETAELFWIATVRADGRPNMTPLVAVWLDDVLHFCTGEAEQKAVNLRRNQHVILMTGCNQWDSGVDVVAEGRATRVTDQPTLERLAEAWARKWDGSWDFEPGPEGSRTSRTTTSWCSPCDRTRCSHSPKATSAILGIPSRTSLHWCTVPATPVDAPHAPPAAKNDG